MRPLTLHASALTDPEYSLYTSALCDLAGEDPQSSSHAHDDSYYAALRISAREARAWVRGRYTDLPPAQVDAVLKLFSPDLAIGDVLTGGQFFAALRLVTHLRHGKDLDGGLVFVQAHPDDAPSKAQHPSSSNNHARNAIPTPPDSHRSSRDVPSPESDTTPTPPEAPVRARPTVAASTVSGAPPPPPPKPLATQGTGASVSVSSTNPFLNRAKAQSQPHSTDHPSQPPPPPPSRKTQSPLPPLPPRKPSNVPPPPPPRHSSVASPNTPSFPASATSPAFAFWHGHGHTHSLSTGGTPTSPNVLIQQSLQAGRIAQSLKRAEERLERERAFEVLKSSSARQRTRSESPSLAKDHAGPASVSASGMAPLTPLRSASPVSGSSGSGSRSSGRRTTASTTATATSKGPALPPRRRASPPASISASAVSGRSFEQVAHASVGGVMPLSAPPRHHSVSEKERLEREKRCTPPPQHPDLVPPPPPTHPDRKPHPHPPPASVVSAPDIGGRGEDGENSSPEDGENGGAPRVYRSKSMHYPAPPPMPPPPPRRRRPESVQYGSMSLRDGEGARRGLERSPSPTYSDRTSRTSPASVPARGHYAHGNGNGTMSRHLSLTMREPRRSDSVGYGPAAGIRKEKESQKEESPIANIRSHLMSLQPKLEAARYKAEAGLSRRGFVNHGRESLWHEESEDRLMSSETEGDEYGSGNGYGSITEDSTGPFGNGNGGRGKDGVGVGDGDGESVGQDSGDESVGGDRGGAWEPRGRSASEGEGLKAHVKAKADAGAQTRGRTKVMRPWEVERDEMKWPVAPGEGWKPL